MRGWQEKIFDDGRLWVPTHGGDPGAKKIHDRHYSKYYYADGRYSPKFTGVGEHLVLVLPDYTALFVWCRNTIKRMDGQEGICCTVFRNESPFLSSELILEAEQWAWDKWEEPRMFTHINPHKIKSQNPGYCFKMAGWRVCGKTKVNKLIIMEKIIGEE